MEYIGQSFLIQVKVATYFLYKKKRINFSIEVIEDVFVNKNIDTNAI